ncbi:MAG TPA: hypothetical protein VFN10_08380 [Thermoanaerobaculia bacterium]|nr:hypothetical protein [Thermoanaerobaculia bacterium]
MPLLYSSVKVRVQARGGKFLGPAVKAPKLTVRNVLTGEVLIDGQTFDNSSSGTVLPESSFQDDISRGIVIVQPGGVYPQPGPYWLEPPSGAAQTIAQVPLQQPSLLEFIATAYQPSPVTASAAMWVMPGMQLLDDPGLVLTMQGLIVEVMPSASGGTVSLKAHVAMMCGCPITQPMTSAPPNGMPEPYWPDPEFLVSAQLRGNGGTNVYAFDLTCTGTSTYTGSQQVPSGTYEVWVVATQRAETNVGFGTSTITVK